MTRQPTNTPTSIYGLPTDIKDPGLGKLDLLSRGATVAFLATFLRGTLCGRIAIYLCCHFYWYSYDLKTNVQHIA